MSGLDERFRLHEGDDHCRECGQRRDRLFGLALIVASGGFSLWVLAKLVF